MLAILHGARWSCPRPRRRPSAVGGARRSLQPPVRPALAPTLSMATSSSRAVVRGSQARRGVRALAVRQIEARRTVAASVWRSPRDYPTRYAGTRSTRYPERDGNRSSSTSARSCGARWKHRARRSSRFVRFQLSIRAPCARRTRPRRPSGPPAGGAYPTITFTTSAGADGIAVGLDSALGMGHPGRG